VGGCGDRSATEPGAAAPSARLDTGLQLGPGPAAAAPATLDQALLLALSVFPAGPDGKPGKKPGDATLLILRREAGRWVHEVLQDAESNVFHKAVPFRLPGREPGLLTISGNAARLRLWRRGATGWGSETLWAPSFGGTHNRLRDMELADFDLDGQPEIVLATHDQGVVAVVNVAHREIQVRELDREPDTFVHEVEVGDLDGDGLPDILATPSHPNTLRDEPQPGQIRHYTADGQREVFVDLGDRHAKEVLIADLDTDGQPEVYASVEGRMRGRALVASVEVRRFLGSGGPGETRVTLVGEDADRRRLLGLRARNGAAGPGRGRARRDLRCSG
jgi:hypothetical protein